MSTSGKGRAVRSKTTFEHTERCCYAALASEDGLLAYGTPTQHVVGYGRWDWLSMSLWLVPEATE